MRKISNSDIRLGEPLPFSVFDTDGRLLLREGFIITIPQHISSLVKRGVLIEKKEEGEDGGAEDGAQNSNQNSIEIFTDEGLPANLVNVFEQTNSLILNLKHIFTVFLKNPDQVNLVERIKSLAASIQKLVAQDSDSALAAAYLDINSAPIIVHQLLGAVLVELVAQRLDISQTDRLSYVCAALTRDIGQLSFQTTLDRQHEPLAENLRQEIKHHPEKSFNVLQQVGLRDQLWLDAVHQHHERLNGSGYPEALEGEAISLGGQILAVADVYSAMIKPRVYRQNRSILPQKALQEIYLNKANLFAKQIVELLVKELGIYIPGSLVRLKNNEIAAVKNRTMKAADVIVYSIYDENNMLRLTPVMKNVGDPGCEVVASLQLDDYRSANLSIKRLWME